MKMEGTVVSKNVTDRAQRPPPPSYAFSKVCYAKIRNRARHPQLNVIYEWSLTLIEKNDSRFVVF